MHRSLASAILAVMIACVVLTAQSAPPHTSAPLAGQPPLLESTFTLDERSNALASDQAAFHPARVLVQFGDRGPREFLPGSPAASTFPGNANLFLVQNPPGLSVADAVRRYRANPNVLYAEPDYVVETTVTPTDPAWNRQWDMVKISAPAAWDSHTDASSVVVAIIDTGIDFAHPDLEANLWTDSGGSHGFSCVQGRCTKGGADDHGHGTHVAGTIGAVANNGVGIAGLNWNAQLMSVKFLDAGGSGYISDAVRAFDLVTSLKKEGVNIRLTSNSWGSGGYSQALKDAMARGEAAGILHVCAAGNGNANADSSPMYPAAFDNRGIVSVLATDQNDAGATFTNYGMGSVDIAAPGVSTLSTVPTGSCKLCDSSGYKLLSGTSMATPHVSGVLAAIFHANPSLTPYEARDVVLDPGSYDALTHAKAASTSTGGRLNFAKALAGPLLYAPVLNNFPTLSIGSPVFTEAGRSVTLAASASDSDGDPLRMSWTKSGSIGLTGQWLFGWMLNKVWPSLDGHTPSFTAPSLARTVSIPYDAAVADGRGGSAVGRQYVTVSGSDGGRTPAGNLAVSNAGNAVTVDFLVNTSRKTQVGWDLWFNTKGSTRGYCCFTGSTTMTLSPGVYRVGAQAIDQALGVSTRESVVLRIGGAAGEPPIASATLDRVDGPAPLTVTVDMGGSVDPDGSIRTYYVGCGEGAITGSRKSKMACTFTTPGIHRIQIFVVDNSGYMDAISAYVVATP